MLFFTEGDVRRLLPMREAIRMLREAFEKLASKEAQNQPRRRLPAGASTLHYMAGTVGGYFGAKIYSTNPQHGAYFLLTLYCAETGRPLALFEADHLGQIRTGAASGLATQLISRPRANTLGIIGSGFQARAQVEAMAAVRPLRLVRVFSPTTDHREAFAREYSEKLGIPVEAVDSAEAAVRGMDIVVTATNAKEPVLLADWVMQGAHVNAMGSNHPKRRELPIELIRRAGAIVLDSREQAKMESGDLLLGLTEAGWRSAKIVELVDVVSRKVKMVEDSAITIFKSNGLAIEDVAVAAYVYEQGRETAQRLPVFTDA